MNIKTKKQPKKSIKNSKDPEKDKDKKIILDFAKCNLRTYSNKTFSNKWKNEEEFIKNFFFIITEITTLFSKEKISSLRKLDNTHKIDDKSKANLVAEIAKKLDIKEEDDESEEPFYQLGCKQGLRIIGKLDSNIFKVYFFDQYHLIYPSEKHNNKDYKKYKFCPVEKYK